MQISSQSDRRKRCILYDDEKRYQRGNILSRKSKETHYNGLMKKNKNIINDLEITTKKNEDQATLEIGGEHGNSGRVWIRKKICYPVLTVFLDSLLPLRFIYY